MCVCSALVGIPVPISSAQDCRTEAQVEFNPPVRVHNSLPAFTNPPSMAAFGSNLYLTWFDWAEGKTWIVFSRSPDRGKTVGTPVILSGELSSSHTPQIAAWGNHVYVLWSDGPFWGGLVGLIYRSQWMKGRHLAIPLDSL